jgi:hypothetical protein
MTALTEGRHAAEHILEEGINARRTVTLLALEVVVAGQVLGKLLADRGAVTVSAATFAGTGNGTLTLADPAYGAGVKEGSYKATLVSEGADAGQFVVTRPDGSIDGYAQVGVAYDGEVKFTIADGTTDFAAPAAFSIPVAIADPTGSGKWVAFDQDGNAGSEVAAGIAYANYDATGGDLAIVVNDRDTRVVAAALTWPADIDAGEKAAALAQLDALNIVAA